MDGKTVSHDKLIGLPGSGGMEGTDNCGLLFDTSGLPRPVRILA